MRITQGTFSFLPDLTDDEVRAQIDYALGRGWACSIEHTDDPHPRNVYWNMWKLPMFAVKDAAAVMYELQACRKAHGDEYIKLNAFDSTRGVESMCLSFMVNRPCEEPGFMLEREESTGRVQRYSVRAYSADRPAGGRY